MSQTLYDLPEGWEWVELGDVATLLNGRAYKQHELLDEGKTPVLRVGNFFSNRSWYYSDLDLPEEKYCVEGDLLYAWSASFGPKIWTGQKAIYHYHIWKILTSEKISKWYLYHLLERETESIKASGNGVGMFHATKSGMEKKLIPLPPLAEQTRIVEKLDAVLSRIDTAIDELQQSLALVDAFYKSSLKAKTNDLEGKWTRYSLNELGCFSGGGTPSKSRSDYWGGEILWITPKDMKSWKLSDSEMKITDIGLKESSAKLLPKNSVLIVARSGILQHTLPVAINTVEATVNQDIKVFIPSDKIVAEYVQYMLKGHEAFILSQLVKGGVTVESLKYSEFQEHPFPVPDLQAQIQIVGELDALNNKTTLLKTELTAKIGMFNQLKASVLDGAFRGGL